MTSKRTVRALEVAARQAGGEGFSPIGSDRRLAHDLLAGVLQLRPHPAWNLPDELSWQEDPFGEVNWQAQLHMLRWLDPLRRVAHGTPGARELWISTARSWVRANLDEPRTRWGTDGMVAGIRAIGLTLGLPLVEDPSWILEALERHTEWLTDEKHRAIGNHALWQITGLFVAASALGSAELQRQAAERLERHVAGEYDDEGVNAEGALAYHLNNYRWTMDALRRFELEGVELPETRRRLDGALRELVQATRPDGLLEMIGDTAATRLAGVRSPEVDYLVSHGSDGEPPREVSAVFAAGYAFGRTGWGETRRALVDETFYSLRWGPASRVHGHQDGGSVTYFAGGGPVLIDAGKYGYNRSEMRTHISSRRAHNVVDLAGQGYDRTSVVDLVASSRNDEYDSFLLVDTGYPGASITRAVVFSRRDEWLLAVDRVESASSEPAVARWHVDPRFAVRLRERDAELTAPDVPPFRVTWSAPTSAELFCGAREPLEGWHATGWNQAEPAPVLRIPVPGDGSRVATLIGPGAGEDVHVTVEQQGDAALVEVDLGGSRSWVMLHEGSTPVLTRQRPTGWVDAVVQGVAPVGREVDADAVAQVESLVAALLGHRHGDVAEQHERAAEAVDAARRLGFSREWDYGLGSVLADVGVPREEFAARRPQLLSDELSYRGKAYPVVQVPTGSAPEPTTQPTVHVLVDGPVVLPGLYVPQDGDTLFVGLAGAVDRGQTSLPLFQGVAMHAALPGPSVLFSDPTLDLDADLRLGWYLGTAGTDVHRTIADAVRRYVAALGVRNVVLVGGSGGGFAALQVAAHLDRAAVVAFSPQTSVQEYHPRFRDHALRAVFGGGGPSPADELRLDVVARYRSRPVDAHVLYVQNSGDRFHVERHARPFVELAQGPGFGGTLEHREVAMGEGHVSPSRDTYLEYLRAAAAH